ncbi:hypothetical protein [Cupriavidus sp. RAF12]|uniref:hypothetical protein n=1 Tax=Cupriavidus sp. RAF12 TaxID=3233050 RepID=UPI003F91211F
MTSQDIYADLFSSILKFCGDVAPMIGAGDAKVVNFDAYDTDDEQMPAGDLIGPAQYALTVDEHLAKVTVMIGVMTAEDPNLFRLNAVVGKLLNYLLPGKSFWAVSAETGEKLGDLMVENGTQVFPILADSVRPMKFIGVRLACNVTFGL